MAHELHLKRAYDPSSRSDGRRILVDRLWPRGVTKAEADIDLWLKQVAPTDELREWFGHRPERWDEFRARYREELKTNPALDELRQALAEGKVTLVYGAKDREHNQAVALAEVLLEPDAFTRNRCER
ncbi:MAG: DUF488 domain-containing protein [Caulobacteraceae bacterium]|nr:DUF488 domain-containing protein [Caulobacteraceae bacterium]